MSWVALDRALKLASLAGVTKGLSRWRKERDAILGSLLSDGFDSQVGAFVQSYGSTALDASVLRLPLLEIIDANDPRMRSTIRQIERRLMRNGLVYRYLGSEDGVPGGEGAFVICTFWLINNYVLCDRLKEAEDLFKHVLSFGNDVGLFSEQIDPVKREQLGNFPQAFTHVALVNCAIRIEAAKRGLRLRGAGLQDSREPLKA